MSTSSPSGTRSTHRSGAGSPRSAATSRPFGASRVVAPTSRSRSTSTAEPGDGLDALDDGGPAVGCAVEEVHVGAAPARARGGRAASGRRCDSETSGHASLSGRSVKHGVSSAAVVAEAVPPHRAVVAGLLVADLVGVGVARVREAARRRAARPPTRRGCGGGRRGAACRVATSRTRSVDRSSPPVEVPNATRAPSGDGWYQSMAEVTSPEASAGSMSTRPGPVDRRRDRADDERGAVAVAPPVDREQLVAADGGRQGGAGLGELGQPVAEPPPGRDGVEGGAGALVLGGGPRPHLGRGAVLEPAVGVGDLDPVEDLGGSVGPGGRRRRDVRSAVGATSCGRGWACGRGWPSSCEPAGWPSSCAST